MTGATPIRVLLVDDHALFRTARSTRFREEPDVEVVGEAACGRAGGHPTDCGDESARDDYHAHRVGR
jgi:DNA-binding NarL/FixJ family response regulator